MKILYYFEEKDVFMDAWQRSHIFDDLKRHNCHVTVFNPLQYESIAHANEALDKEIHKNHYDLFMSPHGSQSLYKDSLAFIKKSGLPTVLICFDNLLVPHVHKDCAKDFDLVWLTSRETEYLFKKWGATTMFNPYAANPFLFTPHPTKVINKVAFIGSPYGSRVNMIKNLIDNDIFVDMYTKVKSGSIKDPIPLKKTLSSFYNYSRFPIGRSVLKGALKQKVIGSTSLDYTNTHISIYDPVPMEKFGELYSNYALSLSSTAARNTGVLKNPVQVINLRSFEIPMSGGLQFCEYNKELSEYFEEDKEIVFYRNQAELVEKASYYLKEENGEIVRSMKIAARARAVREHTWFSRFKKVFDYFSLNYEKKDVE